MAHYKAKRGENPIKDYDNFLVACILKLKIQDKRNFVNEMDNLVIHNAGRMKEDLFLSKMATVMATYSTLENSPGEVNKEFELLSKYMEKK